MYKALFVEISLCIKVCIVLYLRDPAVSTLCMLIVDENPVLSDHQAAPPLGRLRSEPGPGSN